MRHARATKVLALAGLAFTCAVASPAAATEAIQSLVGAGVFGGGWGDGAGFAFKPATNIYVNALGYLFSTDYNSLPSAVVELLDARGTLWASATLTTNSPQLGDWSYQAIPAVFLPANSTNFIMAYDPVEYAANHKKSWTGAYVQAVSTNSTWFEAARALGYLGPAEGTAVTDPPWFYLVGANFQFTGAPAPPTLQILRTRTNTVVLTWPTQAVSFSLQATTNLLSWPATKFPASPIVSGSNNVLVVPASQRRTFFRLTQFGVPQAPPALQIRLTRTNTVVLTWPTQAVGFSLQASTNLLSWPATNVPISPVISGTNNVLVLPVTGRRTFFRLIQ
jgi:hypothetical protein